MSTLTLNPLLADRQAKPYAVGVRWLDEPTGDSESKFTHFKNKGLADLYADLMSGDNSIVTRWVAITEPEYLSTTVVQGWRQVTHFVL